MRSDSISSEHALAAGRRFGRALLMGVGAALLIAMIPPQGHAQNAALAYVLSPPPATRGVLPRYLPSISPKDAQPIPPVAADAPASRSAWRQAERVRRSQRHQCRLRQGARRLLVELPRARHAQGAGSCRQEPSARRLRFHRHRLCPRRCGGGPGAMAPGRRPTPPQATKARMPLGRGKPHATNPIEWLS
jgi:hypothetical protein